MHLVLMKMSLLQPLTLPTLIASFALTFGKTFDVDR